MSNISKSELIEAVYNQNDILTKAQAAEVVDSVFSNIRSFIQKGDEVRLMGFGTFTQKNRAARMGRNPKTGEAMQFEASTSVKFKPASTFFSK